jgi:hypothetical protein
MGWIMRPVAFSTLTGPSASALTGATSAITAAALTSPGFRSPRVDLCLRLGAVDVAVEIRVTVHVDVAIAAAPVAVAPCVPPGRAARHAQPE